jgi:hypothetical protein
VFIPLTHLCRDVCHYCTFAQRPLAGRSVLTTIGRRSGDKFVFPLFYGTDGGSYFRSRLEGWCSPTSWMVPQYSRQLGCRGTSRGQEGEGAGQDSGGRGTGPTLEKGARVLAALCGLSAKDRARDPGSRDRPCPLGALGCTLSD